MSIDFSRLSVSEVEILIAKACAAENWVGDSPNLLKKGLHRVICNRTGLSELNHQQKIWIQQKLAKQRLNHRSTEIKREVSLEQLRTQMKSLEIDGFLIPRQDCFLGEWVPPCYERLMAVTGFSGSAGLSIIGLEVAGLFVDGRYTLQAAEEVAGTEITCHSFATEAITEFLQETFPEKAKIGYDPWLCSTAEIARYQAMLNETKKQKLMPIQINPVDALWKDGRPFEPLGFVTPYPLKFAGKTTADKLEMVQKGLQKKDIDWTILNASDQIAWLLNIRGRDVANSPLTLSRLAIPQNGQAIWFIDPDKLVLLPQDRLNSLITIIPLSKFDSWLDGFKQNSDTVSFFLDKRTTPYAIPLQLEQIKSCKLHYGQDIVLLPKAIKNNKEQHGMVTAHIKDGVAMIEFLTWLEQATCNTPLPDELEIAEKLLHYRMQQKGFCGNSFDSIVGSGAHGAIVHYRATHKTNRRLKNRELVLIDSGGQFQEGTTDLTRTLAIGTPTLAMKQDYTKVLKGHIALSRQMFPKNIRGSKLDILARSPLWQDGLDYAHGTGHGVGSFLNVHEGPQSISGAHPDEANLQIGMVLSNEPGLYRTGKYGIRIENLVMVKAVSKQKAKDNFLQFRTLTLVPYARDLIDLNLLDTLEIDWIDRYHQGILARLKDQLSLDAQRWLAKACAPLKH